MQSAVIPKPSPASKILWVAIAIVGAFCLGVVALRRGEPINAIWLVAASIAVFVIGYRFYGTFVNDRVLHYWGADGFYRISQGREVGHDAIIELQVDDEGEVWSGGRACTVVKGHIVW